MTRKTTGLLLFAFLLFVSAVTAADKRDYYEIKLYHLTTNEQVAQVDNFLKNDYIPALHRAGIGKTGVFHPVGNDTAVEKRIYVFIPLRSLEDMNTVEELILTDAKLKESSYLALPFNAPAYKRIETIVLKAF